MCLRTIQAPQSAFLISQSSLSSPIINARLFSLSSSTHNRNSTKVEGKDVAKLVPNSGVINLINDKGAFIRNVSLRQSLARLRRDQKLIVVQVEHTNEEDQDPIVHCKVVSNRGSRDPNTRKSDSGNSANDKERQKQEKKKKAKTIALKTKSVTLGWNIAPNDLLMQKKSSITSWFKKGHPIQIILGKAVRRQNPPTDLDLEKRKILLKTCRAMCEEAGAYEQSVEGDFRSNSVILNYSPPKLTTETEEEQE